MRFVPMKLFPVYIAVILLICSWCAVPADDVIVTINKVEVHRDSVKNKIYFTSGLTIDADGSPRAYHPVSDSGSDALANAGRDGNWWGIITEKGKPVIQGKNDPAPGFYVSCTTLEYPGKLTSDPLRYVNSDSIPYVVLPWHGAIFKAVLPGDIAKVTNLRNGKTCFAVFGDTGPRDKIGEGSIYLAGQLGIASSPRTGGVSDSVRYEIYPQTRSGWPYTRAEIDSIGAVMDSLRN